MSKCDYYKTVMHSVGKTLLQLQNSRQGNLFSQRNPVSLSKSLIHANINKIRTLKSENNGSFLL